jgi:hypothetical protein
LEPNHLEMMVVVPRVVRTPPVVEVVAQVAQAVTPVYLLLAVALVVAVSVKTVLLITTVAETVDAAFDQQSPERLPNTAAVAVAV